MKNTEFDGFKFPMTITKAHDEHTADGTITKMVIKGVASNTRRDKEDHQVTVEGLYSIQKAIEDGILDEDGEWSYVPLRSGHREEWEDKLGDIVKAEIDDDENLWIVAELDVDSSKARDLYVKVSKGNAHGRKPQLGLSVKGKATKYRFGVDPETSTRVTYLEKLTIDEVSVTSKPKNPTPYPLAIYKSLIPMEESTMKNELEQDNTSVVLPDAAGTDQIAQAIAKAHEAAPYTDGTEANAEVPVNPTAAEAEARQEVVADAADTTIERQDVPAGYVAHPHSGETPNPPQAEAVAPASDSDSVTRLASSVEALTNLVSQLRNDVDALRNQNVQKAEPDAQATSVTLAHDEDIEARVTVAVTKAFSDQLANLGLGSLVDEIQVVKSKIEELQQQPNDRSISVSKAKSEDENDPYVRMRRLKESGLDSISAAARSVYPKS